MKTGICVLILVLPVVVCGQITVDYTDIPQEIGMNWWENIANSATIDLGTTGGPHTWDFTSQPMGMDSTLNVIVDKDNTPYIDSFPAANLALLTVCSDDNDTSFLYERLAVSSFYVLGKANTSLIVICKPVYYMPLPVNYGDQWINYYGYNVVYMGFKIRIDNYSHCKVDAYGTVKIPDGEFECLRVCSYDTVITTVPPSYIDTATSIGYRFMAENCGNGYVVLVKSKNGETNPNFTEADSFVRLVNFEGVEENNSLGKQSEDLKASPNPFYSEVNVQYSVGTPGLTSIKIYDAAGNLIKTLVNGYQTAGDYRVKWDGKAENGEKVIAGIYFYRLMTGKKNCVKKVILVK